MDVINVTNARQKLYQLIAEVNRNSQPIVITNNKGKNAVLISEDDWKALAETLHLNSISGLANSIIDGGKESIDECIKYDEDKEW